jgi:hypothetical protein
MITSVFKKSTPLNLFLVIFLMLLFFFITLFKDVAWKSSTVLLIEKIASITLLLASLFTTNFVATKNGISRNSGYTIFFYFLFLLFFPTGFAKLNLIVSNFFVIIAMRRLISIQSLKATKEKVFDASLWIFIASLFHFWSILFLVIVFISIIFHISRDYTNWILPFLAFIAVAIIVAIIVLIFNIDITSYFYENTRIDLKIDYFATIYENIAFSIYITIALFFMSSIFVTLSNRPQIVKYSYIKIILAFFIGFAIYILSPNKSNDLLLFTIAPLSMLATSHIEINQEQLKQELVLGVLILCSLFIFFSQL